LKIIVMQMLYSIRIDFSRFACMARPMAFG
jgi:hypothetical protein